MHTHMLAHMHRQTLTLKGLCLFKTVTQLPSGRWPTLGQLPSDMLLSRVYRNASKAISMDSFLQSTGCLGEGKGGREERIGGERIYGFIVLNSSKGQKTLLSQHTESVMNLFKLLLKLGFYLENLHLHFSSISTSLFIFLTTFYFHSLPFLHKYL